MTAQTADGVEPRRLRLPVTELDRLAARLGLAPVGPTLLGSRAGASPLADRLGDPGPAPRVAVAPRVPLDAPALDDPALDDPDVAHEVAAALAVWEQPSLTVDLDLLLVLRTGPVRLRSRHRRREGWVVALSTADGHHAELAWLAARHWWCELARAALVDVAALRPAPRSGLPPLLDLPWEVVAAPDGTAAVAAEDDVRRWLPALETHARGRLHGLVAGRDRHGRPTAGVVEWVLVDGWRSLTPVLREGERRVRIRRREPDQLADDLALVAGGIAP